MLRSIALFFVLIFSAAALQAQGERFPFDGPQANTIRSWKKLNWQYVATRRAQVNYYGDNLQLARNTGQLAERAIDELQIALDYISESKYLLEVYPDPVSYRQAAHDPDRQPFESVNHNIGAVAWTGDYQSYYRAVKTRLAELLLEDMFYGRGSRRSFQNRALMHLPRWYYEGLAGFLGEGWWPEDEARLRSFARNPAVGVLNERDSQLGHTLRKSIWYFIFRRYGPSKLQEIVYMTRLTRSADGGMVAVIGMDVSDFSRYWEDFITNQLKDERAQPKKLTELNLTNRNEQLVEAQISPKGGMVAYVVRENGRLHFRTYTPGSGRKNTGIDWGYKTHNPMMHYMHVPIAWSPDGQIAAVAMPGHKHWTIAYYSPSSGKVKRAELPPELHMIESLSWSPDKKRLVFNATSAGQTDLYTIAPFASEPARLTRDAFDDLDASWGINSRYIYFSSNRDNNLETASKTNLSFYRNNFDAYRYDSETRQIERLSNTPVANERHPGVIGDSVAVVQSDAIGLPNLHMLGSTRPEPLTNFPTGYYPAGSAQKGVLFSHYDGGQLTAAYWSEPRTRPLESVEMTKLGLLRIASYSDRESKRAEAIADSIRKAEQEAADERLKQQPADTAQQREDDDRIRFYVFDEESTPSTTERERERRRSKREERLEAQKTQDNFALKQVEDIRFTGEGQVGPSLHFEGFDFRIGSHPLQRYYAEAGIQLADMHRYHHINASYRLYDDFRSMDSQINYRFSQYRLQMGANFFTNRRVLEGNYIFKFQSTGFGLSAILPVNRYLRFEAGTQFVGVERTELFVSFTDADPDLEDFSRIHQNSARLVYNSLRRQERFIDRGLYADLSITNNRNLTDDVALFTSLLADVRKYTKLGGITFLTRFNGGASFGPTDQLFMLGGVNDQLNFEMQNEGELPVFGVAAEYYLMRFATPMRMFDFNARSGNKYGIINAEMRMPLFRMFTTNLQSRQLFDMQWILFYDIGTAWNQGNPFSQRNPVSVNTIERPPFVITVENLRSPFLQAFGSGVQGTVFGLTGRMDLGWGIDDGAVQEPRVIVTMGYAF
ncbi:MAG: hypothetical protein ACOCZ8_00365 [Bacteroidota bacterium]